MEALKAIILGIIQGLTEFLPISSSGHLVLMERFLHFETPNLSFEIILHLGSLFAVFIYFRKDISSLLSSLITKENTKIRNVNRKIILYLFISTCVTAFLGIVLEDIIEKAFQSVLLVGVMLSVTGLILFFSDQIKKSTYATHQMGVSKAILIGLGQSLAIFPGISRSGTTIATSVYCKIKREEAARFSFLLSIPAILGATILKIKDFASIDSTMMINYGLGAIAAFVSGYAVISLLIRLVKKQKLKYFSFYCWLLSLFVICTEIF